MAQIQMQIENLHKKLDKLLTADMKSAQTRLEQAVNYAKNKMTYPLAYDEFNKVLDKVTDAFHKVEDFEYKVFCKRVAIFARFMINTYDLSNQTFSPLSSLPVDLKCTMAHAIHCEVKELLNETKAFKIALSKKILMQGSNEQKTNQDLLDSVLRVCVPLMWHYVPDFQRSADDPELLKFIPEGCNDASTIALENGLNIKLWKEGFKSPKLKWSPW